MALFEAKGIYKRFGQQAVLENVNLAFEENQVSGIVGPNGAGKSTLFNVLTGHYKPNRGRVIFEGQDVTGSKPHQLARMGVARSFQIMNLFDDFTALENITVALRSVRHKQFNPFHNIPTDTILQEQAHAVLERIGLAEHSHTEARNLSYGNRRALEIGVALATEPRILFLDEPTQGLGANQHGHLIELIESLRENLTIVVIEHDMQFLLELADVISVILWGQVIETNKPEALFEAVDFHYQESRHHD